MTNGVVEEVGLVASDRRGYSAKVRYRYGVNGEAHVASRIAWNMTTSPEQFVAAHPAGTEVTVYYDPRQPGRACLMPGNALPVDPVGRAVLLSLVVGANFVLIICVLGLCTLWRN